MSVKTYIPKKAEIERKWFIVDAEGQTLGRLASRIASILRGKHKPMYTPHLDTGDYVIVINAEKIEVTGNKHRDKLYYRHSRYPGGLRSLSFDEMIDKHPERVLRLAVKGMMPSNALGRAMMGKLKIYAGPDHPHAGQQPETLSIER